MTLAPQGPGPLSALISIQVVRVRRLHHDGNEKKVMELDLSSFEVLSGSQSVSSSSSSKSADEVVKFSEVEMDDVLIGEEEIPF